MKESKAHPSPKGCKVEVVGFRSSLIKRWSFDTIVHIDISFKHKGEDARPTCPKSIIEHWQPVSKEDLSRIAIIKSKPKLAEYKNNVFVKVVADEDTNSPISPPTMS